MTSAFFDSVLGLHAQPQNLNVGQISLRAVIVFICALVMLRTGDKRFLSRKTVFDAVLGFILASVLARAVNGSSAFFPTLGGGFVLVGLHRLIARISRQWHWFGNLVKGQFEQIIKDGVVIERAMHKNNISEHDLLEDLRMHGNVGKIEDVKEAYVERNGHVSVVK